MFGKNKTQFFPDSIVRCGCFVGTTRSHIIDQQDIDSPLPIAVDKIVSFIERNTLHRSEIERIHRIDIRQYPAVAIREAVINAIVHADYSVIGSSIQVAIFSDRLEITNPGTLPFGLSLAKALSGISQLRNRVIGRVFRELGLIERWGSGFSRIIDVCRESGVVTPKFEEFDHHFRVTFYYEITESIVKKELWKQGLIEYLHLVEHITTKDAAIFWNVSDKTASTRLKKMYGNGLIIEISTGTYDPKKKFALLKK